MGTSCPVQMSVNTWGEAALRGHPNLRNPASPSQATCPWQPWTPGLEMVTPCLMPIIRRVFFGVCWSSMLMKKYYQEITSVHNTHSPPSSMEEPCSEEWQQWHHPRILSRLAKYIHSMWVRTGEEGLKISII